VGDPSLWEPTPWAMGVAHAPKNHRAQGALLQKPTHPAKQLGSDPNSSNVGLWVLQNARQA
jgi:hypothetical protein